MIELSTRTGALVRLVDDLLPDGAPVKVLVIKQRYLIVAGVAEPVPGAELRLVDEPWEPGTTGSPKLPSDLALCKLGTDVIVSGEAMARDGASVTSLDVFVAAGPVSRALRVTGTRVWYESFGGMQLTPPEPFTAVPLRWELAWGGTDHDEATGRLAEDPRNPYGRGATLSADRLRHRPGPQIEDPAAPIVVHDTALVPVGIAATTARMAHRRSFAGTLDDDWQRTRMPLRPRDFDLRYFHAAAPGLTTERPLRGDERVQVVNMSRQGALDFALPRASFGVQARTDLGRTAYRADLDTVLLLPNESALELVWRSRIPLSPGNGPRLRAVQVFEREVIR